MPRLRAARRHHDQDVDGLGHFDQGRKVGIGDIRLLPAPVVGHGHAEPFNPFCDRLADTAETDNANAAPTQGRGQRIGGFQPRSVAQMLFGAWNFAHGRKQKAESQIGHLVRQHIGRVRHDHAALRCRLHIHAVIADRRGRDDLKGREPLHHFAWQRRDKGDNAANMRSDLVEECFLVRRVPISVERDVGRKRGLGQRTHRVQHQDVGLCHVCSFPARNPNGDCCAFALSNSRGWREKQ
jgi:hypothetical protein